MAWINEPPTKDGYWWVRSRGVLNGEDYVHPVKVYNDCSTVFSDGENFTIDCDLFLQWWDREIPTPLVVREVKESEEEEDWEIVREIKSIEDTPEESPEAQDVLRHVESANFTESDILGSLFYEALNGHPDIIGLLKEKGIRIPDISCAAFYKDGKWAENNPHNQPEEPKGSAMFSDLYEDLMKQKELLTLFIGLSKELDHVIEMTMKRS